MNPEHELPLPAYARDLLSLESMGADRSFAKAKGFLRSRVLRNDAKAELSHRDVLFIGKAPPGRRPARQRPRTLPGRAISKRLGLHSLRRVDYSLATEANRLWLAYAVDCVQFTALDSATAAARQAAEAVLRLDLTGAEMRVVAACTASQVGLAGICLMETKLSFRLAAPPDGRVLTIPKVGSTFELTVGGTTRLTLFGSQLTSRPAERMTRKFRSGTRPPCVDFASLLEKAAADVAAAAAAGAGV